MMPRVDQHALQQASIRALLALDMESSGATIAAMNRHLRSFAMPIVEKPKRVKPVAPPLSELPAIVADDVQRLAANDASKTRDGTVSVAVLERDLNTLRRAFAKRGLVALMDGIEIALSKNLGIRYAAGCVRNSRVEESAWKRMERAIADDGDEMPLIGDYEGGVRSE